MKLKLTINVDIENGDAWIKRMTESISYPVDNPYGDHDPRIPVELRGNLMVLRIKPGEMDKGRGFVTIKPTVADCHFDGVMQLKED